MKKLLFTMFYAITALVSLSTFLHGSDTYAAACPDTNPGCNDAICGEADGGIYRADTIPPSVDRCTKGSPTTPTWDGNSWNWTCNGNPPDGADESCSTMSLSTNGACGLSNGQSFFGAPTQYLCASNSALIGSAPSGNGPWSWQCRGVNSNATCNAQVDTRTFSWEISSWGACYESTAGTCNGTYQAAGACGTEGQIVAGSIGYDGSPNGPYEGMFCREFTTPSSCNQNWVTHPCNWHNDAYRTESCSEFTSSNSCTSNAGCSWQTSGQQIQDRTVVCKDNNGNVVADSFCGYPKPATTQPCGTSNSCGGYSHVYVKELNYNQTNNWTAPGEVACSPSVWQFDRSRTSTYGFFSDSAGTIPINVNNLIINYNENGTYGSSSHSTNVTGGNYSLVSRHEESYDFPPAACAVYSEFNASITNNSCVTVITGSGVPGTCGSANGGSFPSVPSANLCSSGIASAVSGTGPWSWQCLGTNGGATASCSATRSTTPVNAVCGTSHGQATSAFPTAGLCSVGTPFITSVSPDGFNFFTWTCLGSDGGANASCNAPYVAMACVPYAPLTTHAGLNTNIIPNNTNDVAVALNNTSFPNLTSTGGFMSGGVMRNTVIYTNSGSYSFTGAITSGQYLKVTINNLASVGQFVQLRSTQNNTAGPFYGCNASQWNYSHPLSWPYNQSLANVGIQASAGDPLWGFVNPITQDNGVSGFLAWFKPGKGFEVRCEVCALSTPVTTRSSACENLPAHAIANTTSTIVQNYIAGSWSPSTIFTYNTTPSTSECRFVCETGYNRNGSACVQNPPVNTCESHYGESCTGTGDTLGYGGSCIGHTQATLGTCNTNTSVSCTAASQCPDRVTPTWFPTAYTPATGSIGLSGDEVKIFNSNGGYIGICSKKVFDFYSGKVPYSVLNAEGMGSWDGDGWYNPRSAVYAIGEPSYYLFNNQNLGTTLPGNTYYYTKLCRNINGAAISATSNSWDSIYFIGPVTSNNWYRHDVVYRYNAHVYSWGNSNWAGFQSRVLKPADHPSQPATVTKQCNGYIPEKAGNYYCATSGVQCAPSNAVASYFSNSNYPFSQSLKDGFTSFTSYRDAYYHGFGVSNSALQLCRGLTGSGDLIRASYPGTNGRGVGMSSLGSAGVLNVWNCSNGTQTLSCPGYVMSGSTNW